MSTLEPFTYLVLNILPIIILFRDWKFCDKRTKKHHTITKIIISVWFVVSFLATYFAYSDKLQIKELIKGNEELIEGKNILIKKIDDYQTDLKEKDEKIKLLEEKVKKTERGIISSYKFNGTKNEMLGPGNFVATLGRETEVFKKMDELIKQKNYPELIKICKEQITETPEWLTPYLYLGAAYAETGNKNKAIEMFEYVQKNAYGNPKYSIVNEFLKELKSELK